MGGRSIKRDDSSRRDGAVKRTLGREIAGEELAEGARGRLLTTHADLIRARDGAELTPLGVSRAITISRP